MDEVEKPSHSVYLLFDQVLRYSFVSPLSDAFRRVGISVLMDCNPWDPDNKTGIQEPSASVLIYRHNYVEDMKKLNASMMGVLAQQRVSNEHMVVVPVFCGVYPYHDDGWERLSKEMQDAKSLPEGLVCESEVDPTLVDSVVRDMYERFFTAERIGVYSRLLEIENIVWDQPWGVRSLGICGMPGIGKTTLARAASESLEYYATCFIQDFDETFQKKGLYQILDENFGRILKQDFGVNSITTPKLLREKLGDKKILVVLDGVCDPLAAKSFLGGVDWLGSTSLIIITSRDRRVFRYCRINQVYQVQGLNNCKALRLFAETAFEKHMPEPDVMELSEKVIEYANGNPLCLVIYGQELKRKKDSAEMEAAFVELKKRPPQKIQDVLMTAYNALSENEKNILLDIACFFRGENVEYVMQMLQGSGLFPRHGIDVLVDNFLVSVADNTVQMHNLIREIINLETVQTESCHRLFEPGIIRYKIGDEGPESFLVDDEIDGIVLDTSNWIFDVKSNAFENMFKVSFLKLYGPKLNFPKGLNSLPCKLRFLHWENCPLESLPHDFNPEELVVLDMPRSHLQRLSVGMKLKMLKVIRLCDSEQLGSVNIHSYSPNIELIDLRGCVKLWNFQASSQNHLRAVNLTGCKRITRFPELPPNVEELHLSGTSIGEVPVDLIPYTQTKPNCNELLDLLKDFPGLEHINMTELTNLVRVTSITEGLGKLRWLDMKDCHCLNRVPNICMLESVQVLELSGCSVLKDIVGLPKNLKELYVAGTAIRLMPPLPGSLEILDAHGCMYLEYISFDAEKLPRHFRFSNCFSLPSKVIDEILGKLIRVSKLAREEQQELIKAPAVNICVQADTTSVFAFSVGHHLTVKLSPSQRKTFTGFVLAVIVSFQGKCDNTRGLGIQCTSLRRKQRPFSRRKRVFRCWDPMKAPNVSEDHLFVCVDPEAVEHIDPDTMLELEFSFHVVSGSNQVLDSTCSVKKCGVLVLTAPTTDDDAPHACEITTVAEEVESERLSMTEKCSGLSNIEPEAKKDSIPSNRVRGAKKHESSTLWRNLKLLVSQLRNIGRKRKKCDK